MGDFIYLSNKVVWRIFSITTANNRKGIGPFKFENVGLKFVDEFMEDDADIQKPYNADMVSEKKRRFEIIDKKEFVFFAIKYGIDYHLNNE